MGCLEPHSLVLAEPKIQTRVRLGLLLFCSVCMVMLKTEKLHLKIQIAS